ncbi:hypothetical protein [Longilinea arvoryzae]
MNEIEGVLLAIEAAVESDPP